MTPKKPDTRIKSNYNTYKELFLSIVEKNIIKTRSLLKKYRFNSIESVLALSAAVEMNNLAVTKLLLKNGANRLDKDSSGRIALHKAHSKAMVNLLMQENPEEQLKSKDYHGVTPLDHMRITNCQGEAFTELLKLATKEVSEEFSNTPTKNNLLIEYPTNFYRQLNYRRGIRKGFSR